MNGEWFNSKNRYDVFNPANGEKLSDVPISDNKELELLKKCNINQYKIKTYSGDDLLLNFIYKKIRR